MAKRLTRKNHKGKYVVFNYLSTTGEFKTLVDRLAAYEDIGTSKEFSDYKRIGTSDTVRNLCSQAFELDKELADLRAENAELKLEAEKSYISGKAALDDRRSYIGLSAILSAQDSKKYRRIAVLERALKVMARGQQCPIHYSHKKECVNCMLDKIDFTQ